MPSYTNRIRWLTGNGPNGVQLCTRFMHADNVKHIWSSHAYIFRAMKTKFGLRWGKMREALTALE